MLDTFTSFAAIGLGLLTGVIVKLTLDARQRKEAASLAPAWEMASEPLAPAPSDAAPEAPPAPAALATIGLAPVRAEAEPSQQNGAPLC